VQAFDAIGQIGGLVVQPGVEFSPMSVHHLSMGRDPGLKAAIAHHSGVCLEAHSTDYQHAAAFPRLAALGFAFQKVGPALTFAYRQAVYALDQLRADAGWGEPVIRPEMERIMLAKPGYWQGHYHGDAASQHVQRHFGLADRIRYYWPQAGAHKVVSQLLADLQGRAIPIPLLWQHFSPQVLDRADLIGGPLPQALIAAQIELALDPYFFGETVGPR
jgi:D-tagatose-1,6-bisphosphate aldolase subunit GatZ/KbaZ